RGDAACQIDEGEPAMAKRDARFIVNTLAVRTAMRPRVRHRLDQGIVKMPSRTTIEEPRQTAHNLLLPFIPTKLNPRKAGASWSKFCFLHIACLFPPTRATRSVPFTN